MNNIPFPQANSLFKICKLICLFNYSSRDEIMTRLKLSSLRQFHYYRSAAHYLGF